MMARRREVLSITCLLATICAPLPVLAQTPAPTEEAAGPAAQSGVLSFPPEFFAEARPTTASEMVGRVPGFVMIDIEQDVRGLAGATGNILVDGQVPSLKSVSLRSFLQLREYTPRPDLAFRFQVENFSSRERTRIRELYSGPRDVAGISAIERRSATFEPFFFARVRKTF